VTEVVGVFVRFRAPLHLTTLRCQKKNYLNDVVNFFIKKMEETCQRKKSCLKMRKEKKTMLENLKRTKIRKMKRTKKKCITKYAEGFLLDSRLKDIYTEN
jgi:hypothetical protein